MPRSIIYCAIPLCILVAGCRDNSASFAQFTHHRLDVLGDVITLYSPEECLAFNSVEEFVEESKKRGYIAKISPFSVKDYWEKPLTWQARKTGSKTVVRIISSGENRIFEGGGGDDISVEVTFAPDGKSEKRLIPERIRD